MKPSFVEKRGQQSRINTSYERTARGIAPFSRKDVIMASAPQDKPNYHETAEPPIRPARWPIMVLPGLAYRGPSLGEGQNPKAPAVKRKPEEDWG
jgi:hypothetical protein